jgi:Protein of unknown function (DUF3047)
MFDFLTKLGLAARVMVCSLPAVLLLACATAPESADVSPSSELGSAAQPWVAASSSAYNPKVWLHYQFPTKTPTAFTFGLEEGRPAIEAKASSSASMIRQLLRVEPGNLGGLKFSWKLPELVQYADMSAREFDDSAVRIVMAFDGDRSKFSMKNSMLSELARLVTGEELPYATLMYVWCNECDKESVIVNPQTDRIRKIAIESGPDKLKRWVDHERNLKADFEKAFGEAPGALVSIGLMTDTDNTKSSARAWYGPVTLTKPQ